MGKKSYKAVSVNDIQGDELRQCHLASEIVVGVDVAKEKFVACFMDRSSGKTVRTVGWRHPAETPLFVGLVAGLEGTQVALESTGRYGDALVHKLRASGTPVFGVSTKRVHDAAEEFDGVPSKHDGKDAAVIADLHRRGKSQPLRELTPSMRRLSAVTTTMLRFKAQYLLNMNRMEAELTRFWPELASHIGVQAQGALRLLAAYGTPGAVAAAPLEAAETIREGSSGKIAKAKIERILLSAKTTEGVPAVQAEVDMVRLLAEEALRMLEAWKKAEAHVHAAVLDDCSAARQAKVIGLTTAAILMAKSGDAANFAGSRPWLKNLGLNLKECSSGSGGQRGVHITKRGAPESRQYLHLAALRLLHLDPVVSSWYAHQCSRPGAVKMCIIVKLTRKLAKAMPHVARGADFDVSKLFDMQQFPMLERESEVAA